MDELSRSDRGDMLVFSAASGDSRNCGTSAQTPAAATEVLPLYAGSVRRSRTGYSPGGQRRIMLATNVAETSVTVRESVT